MPISTVEDVVFGPVTAPFNAKVPPSEFSHTVELVLGQNNIPFWTRTVDRLAVAVTADGCRVIPRTTKELVVL